MAVIGGALDEMTRLKSNFDRQSQAVDELMAALRSDLDSVYWKGGAAERFRTSWETEYEPSLRGLSAALIDAATEVGNRRQALEAAGG